MTVTGSGFSSGINSVTLGGVAIPSALGSITSDTQLAFTVPGAAVTGTIKVTTPGGTATSATEFVVIPAITSFSPSSGSASAGTPITFNGSGLMGITGITFSLGATSAVATPTTQTANELIVPVPSGAPTGLVTVTFLNSYNLTPLLSEMTVTP